MEALLKQIVEEVPYCNFAGLYRVNGLPFPESLGDNCLGQVRRYRTLLTQQGKETRIAKPVGDMHYALIVLDGGEWFFTDPSQNQCQVAPISPALRGGIVRAQAYPILPSGDSRIELTASTQVPNGLNVRTLLVDGGSECIKLDVHYNAEDEAPLPAPDDLRMAALPQPQLLLRVADEREVIKLSRSLTERSYTIRTHGRRSETQNYKFAYNSRFESILGKIADRVSLRPAELLSYFDQAADLYDPVQRRWFSSESSK